jgi:hypothetical protein
VLEPLRAGYFGTVRTMSSESARKKLRLYRYLSRYAPGGQQLSLV